MLRLQQWLVALRRDWLRLRRSVSRVGDPLRVTSRTGLIFRVVLAGWRSTHRRPYVASDHSTDPTSGATSALSSSHSAARNL